MPSLPDRKISRAALQFLRSFSNRFSLLCSCLAVLIARARVCAHRVRAFVGVIGWVHPVQRGFLVTSHGYCSWPSVLMVLMLHPDALGCWWIVVLLDPWSLVQWLASHRNQWNVTPKVLTDEET